MSDIREWLAVHFPDALPWQVDYAEAMVAADREGLRLSVTHARQYGRTTARAMAEECRKAFAETEGTP